MRQHSFTASGTLFSEKLKPAFQSGYIGHSHLSAEYNR
ncbi:hypothetical protein THL1_4021 [Pseudomonas sp. TCU-HL1]|nr:hypothetical protein THL1_4021 [Pseudomonas sp. TCU-HL1]